MTDNLSWTAPLRAAMLLLLAPLAACGNNDVIGANNGGGPVFSKNPCTPSATVSLAENQALRVDCSGGGTTVSFAGGGANYLVVTQFANDSGPLSLIPYSFASGTVSGNVVHAPANPFVSVGREPAPRPSFAQMAADRWLRARGRRLAASGRFSGAMAERSAISAGPKPVPPAGSIASFKVLSNFSNPAYTTVGAKLVYVGNNILLYQDTLSPSGGFSPGQLQSFGAAFDTLYFALDTATFGSPSDIDGNQRLIMLMSPVVNGDTPRTTCSTQGFVAGFFNEEDFNTVASDANSNHAEIFYSIVPDSTGIASCAHTVAETGFSLEPTFMHELQHLINFSQHAIIHGGNPMDSWLDEGLSIVAEEQGSLYWEAKCPFPSTACRSNAGQLFPDSSQGFISNFFYDSYQYALLPDTSSITLHEDSQNGFAWRGGAWLVARYLGDQYGNGVYRALEQGQASATGAIASAAGRSFQSVFADLGIALYADSLPGMSRTTAPAADRFLSRNMRQLWARLFATSGPASDVPAAMPIAPTVINADTTTLVLQPGTMSFWRLNTNAADSTVTVRFSKPAGTAFSNGLKAQIAIYRLPAGQ